MTFLRRGNQIVFKRLLSSSPSSSPQTTHFGFKTVEKNEKEKLVGDVFKSVASSYDVMNDAMSLGIHRLWKDHFIKTIAPSQNTKLLDVAGGTGDISFRFLDYIKNIHGDNTKAQVTVLDINAAMLKVGESRAEKFGYKKDCNIDFVEGNAEDLVSIPSESVDCYTIAFGIRNCTNVDKVIKEAYRVLKPGGRFSVLEFSKVENAILRRFYDEYSFQLIPAMGEAIANDRDSYQYLVESIRKFPSQEEFASLIKSCGFTVIGKGYENLTLGVAAIHTGWKL